MSQKQKPNLAAALADISGSTRRPLSPLRSPVQAAHKVRPTGKGREEHNAAERQPSSRAGTVPITGHFPKQVRDQLKMLAIERQSTLHNLMAEAYNDLFAKYGKVEIVAHAATLVEK